MHTRSILVAVVVGFVIVVALVFCAIYSLQHESSSWTPVIFGGSALGLTTSSTNPVSQPTVPWASHPASSCTDPVQYLDISQALVNAPSVCNFKIVTSSLSEIPSSTFQLKNLEALVVLTNNLESIPPDIGTLTGLSHLYIEPFRSFSTDGGATYSMNGPFVYDAHYVFGRNLFTSLPPEIGNLTNLVDLEIDGSDLESIPPEIGNLTQLQGLEVQDAQLTDIPPEIGKLTQLSTLGFASNAITDLPDAVYGLTNLSSLGLADNQITSISPKIGQLTRLTSLDLTDNDLTAVPDEIGSLTGLTYLSLRGNQLTTLPSEIGNLSNLQTLVVSFNQLTALPDSIGSLSNLTSLSVSFNNLTTLPSSIGNLKKLQTLYLYGNPISPQELRKIQALVPQATVSFVLP